MTVSTYALIESGSVINMIAWDGDTETWQPPAGQTAVPIPAETFVDLGYIYSGNEFAAPATP